MPGASDLAARRHVKRFPRQGLRTAGAGRAQELMIFGNMTAIQAVEQVIRERAVVRWRDPVKSDCAASRVGRESHRRALRRRAMSDEPGMVMLRKYFTVDEIVNGLDGRFPAKAAFVPTE